jgi:uncharacterized protein (TIGR03086 family)
MDSANLTTDGHSDDHVQAELSPSDKHRVAMEAFQDVLRKVTADQWAIPTPCDGWDVTALVDHVITGNTWVQTVAGRKPAPVPGGNKTAAVALSGAGAHDVFASKDGLTRTYDLPFGQTPGAVFVTMRTNDLLTHAWDLAKATGQSTDIAADLSAELLVANRARITEALRGEGKMFGLEQQAPEGATAADKLAAFLGRRV